MVDQVNWAILGTGAVSNRFATALQNIPEQAALVAVGSRKQESADHFASKYDIPARYGSYADVVLDPEVDVVYIGKSHVLQR